VVVKLNRLQGQFNALLFVSAQGKHFEPQMFDSFRVESYGQKGHA
jgi:hypothetical protein